MKRPRDSRDILKVNAAIDRATCWRRAFVTSNGWLGFGPPSMDVGDIVVVLAGADVPFVVRPKGDGNGDFLLVGRRTSPG